MKNKLLMLMYLAGYKGWLAPRALRRLFAKNAIHRYWLAGYMGSFVEGGVKIGVCDRDWYHFRNMQFCCSNDKWAR